MIIKLHNNRKEWINTDHIVSIKEMEDSSPGIKIKTIDGDIFYEDSIIAVFLQDIKDIKEGKTYQNRKLNPYKP